jgi:hypothetical protein
MPWKMFFGFIFLTMLLSAVSVQAENSIIVGGQLMPLGPIDLTHPSAANSAPTPPASPLASGLGNSHTIFRDVPSLSGTYSVGGRTLRPYVGAGFSNGYATDLDRSLHIAPSTPSEPGLRGMLGQNVAPSEFQWGVRIPF